jgi:hypothetical protein
MKRLVLLALLLPARAFAQDAPAEQPAPPPPQPPAQPPPEQPKDDPNAQLLQRMEQQMRALEKRLDKAEEELDAQKDDNKYLEDKINAIAPQANKISGYLDFGFFATGGNGAGTRSDLSGTLFPKYAGKIPGSWVFYGDPLSTAINSRGDVADTGESRAVTFDPVSSHGKSTFIVNALNLSLFSGIGETAQLDASVDFIPRARDVSDTSGLFLGDYLDVKLAYAEWRPRIEAFDLMLQAGKFDSVLGYEYRSLESPDRTGVTPSLICRYTCGRPLGLKARAQFFEDKSLIANVAITNGSHFHEGFDFSDEIDSNQLKTVAGRLSYIVAKKVEIGVSGAYGAQDFQPSNDVRQWHVGADVHAELGDLELTAEIVKGRAKGKTDDPMNIGLQCDVAPCLHYRGAYILAAYRVNNTFIPYFRVDNRNAVHESGASFVYLSTVTRFTAGLRAEIGSRVIVKAEGTLNREMDWDGSTPTPSIPDDVVTSSLVIKY